MRLRLFDEPPRTDTGPRSLAAVKMLRLSVTDRCNYRCVYCMPAEGVRWLGKDELLSDDELISVATTAAGLGIDHIKLTGGEPTLRPRLVNLVERLSDVPGVRDLSMTTNGQLLEVFAGPLARAGLGRVTVSLDTLKPEKFRMITRGGDLAAVLRGIGACSAAGIVKIKVNVVVVAGVNDDEIVAFAHFAQHAGVTVRFIEYMPLGDSIYADAALGPDDTGPAGGCGANERATGAAALVPERAMRERIEDAFGPLRAVERGDEIGVGPAVPFDLPGGGRVAFISAMSTPFCATCNRLRLTASGVLRSCLFEGGEVDLKPLLRDEMFDRDAAVARAFVSCVAMKPVFHTGRGRDPMSRIGG